MGLKNVFLRKNIFLLKTHVFIEKNIILLKAFFI